MKKIIYLFVFSFLFIACKKEYHVSGRVYNPINNEGLANVKIVFLKSDYGSIPGGYKEVASALTDASGNYDLKFKGQAERVKINPSTDLDLYVLGNFLGGQYHTEMLLSQGKNQVIDWHAVPYGNYGIIVNNLNCQGLNDTIIINQQNQLNSFLDTDWILTGCSGYTSSIDKVPMGNVSINWTVIRNGNTTSFSDNIFVNEGQNVIFTLDY